MRSLARLAACAAGLVCLHASPVRAQPVFESVNRASGLPSDYINGIYQDRFGFLWFGTDSGLARYDGQRVETFTVDDGLPHPFVYDVLEDGEGTLWVGTFRGLARFDGTRFHVSPEPFGEALVGEVTLDARKRLVVHTELGIARREGDTWRIADRVALPSIAALRSIAALPGDRLIGVGQGAIYLIEPDEDRFSIREIASRWLNGASLQIREAGPETFFLYSPNAAESFYRIRLDQDQVILEDSAFVGTIRQLVPDGEGGAVLYIDDGRQRGVYRMDADLQMEDTPLHSERAEALLMDYEGSLWIGTFGKGAFRLRAEHIQVVTESPAARIALAPDGDVWASGVGVWQIDAKTLSSQRRYASRPIREVHFSDAGEVWLSSRQLLLQTRWRDGDDAWVFRTDPGWVSGIDVAGDTVRMSSYSGGIRRMIAGADVDTLRVGGGLPTDMIEGLKRASGSLWALTRSHGAFRIQGGSALQVGRDAGLPSSAVFSVYGATDGSTWFGTDRGVARLAPGAEQAVAMGEEILDGQRVTAMFERAGRIWIVGDRTVYMVAAGEVQPVGGFPILPDDGSSINDAVHHAEADRVFLATTTGVVAVELAALPVGPSPRPRIAIRGMQVGDNQIAILGSPLVAHVEPIDPGRHRVEVEFAPLSFAGGVRTEVRLNDGEWNSVGTDHRIVFPELGRGSYQLDVRAVSAEGAVSSQAASLSFTVKPYWWQRPVSMVLAGLLALGLLVLGVRYVSQRRLREQIRQLEVKRRLHDERERISRDLHDHVGAQLSSLLAGVELARLERRASGDGAPPARDPNTADALDGVEADARTTMRQLRETIWALHGASVSMEEFASRVRSDLSARRTDLSTRVTCTQGRDETLSPVQALNLFRVTQEAITNVLKHADARQLEVTLAHDGTTVRVEVQDDGVFRQPTQSDRASPLDGFGLRSMQARAERLGGTLELDTSEGTRVRVAVPADAIDVT
ncbi:MAG: hypothetical protein Rubg2KO_09260 [Rubricoccaceae bacterium]